MWRSVLLLLVLLAWAAPARAWNTCGAFNASSATTAAPGVLAAKTDAARHQYAALCHDTTGTTGSPLLVTEAQSILVELDPNMEADDSGSAGCLVQVYRCRSTTATASDLTSCTKELADTNADGLITAADDVTLNGVGSGMRRGIQNIQAKFLLVVPTANPNSHQCRTMVEGF